MIFIENPLKENDMPGKKRITSEPLAPADMEEEDFVRGGGSELPPIVHKQIKDVCLSTLIYAFGF